MTSEKEKDTLETLDDISGPDKVAEARTIVKVDNGESAISGLRVESDGQLRIPYELAVLPLRNVVLYPMAATPLTVGQPRSIRLVNDALVEQRIIALTASKEPEVDEPGPDQVYRIGTAANITIDHEIVKETVSSCEYELKPSSMPMLEVDTSGRSVKIHVLHNQDRRSMEKIK